LLFLSYLGLLKNSFFFFELFSSISESMNIPSPLSLVFPRGFTKSSLFNLHHLHNHFPSFYRTPSFEENASQKTVLESQDCSPLDLLFIKETQLNHYPLTL